MTGDPELTPQEAAAALLGLESYEETVTARAFGMTMMAFGIANAATALSYALGEPWAIDEGIPWILSFLWLPWIGAAGLLTSVIWRSHSISLRRDHHEARAKGERWYFVAFAALYIALLALVSLGSRQAGIVLSGPATNLIVLGLFTLALGAFFQRGYGPARYIRPVFVVAVLSFALGWVFTTGSLGYVPDHLLGALAGLGLWGGAGLYVAARG